MFSSCEYVFPAQVESTIHLSINMLSFILICLSDSHIQFKASIDIRLLTLTSSVFSLITLIDISCEYAATAALERTSIRPPLFRLNIHIYSDVFTRKRTCIIFQWIVWCFCLLTYKICYASRSLFNYSILLK